MNLRRAAPGSLLLLAVVILLAPGLASLIGTPYGLPPPHLWLATIYLGGTTWSALALGMRALNSHRSVGLRGAAVVLLAAAFALVVLLAYGSAITAYQLFGTFPGGTDWLLFNKYFDHLASSASNGYLWVASLCLLCMAIALTTRCDRHLRIA